MGHMHTLAGIEKEPRIILSRKRKKLCAGTRGSVLRVARTVKSDRSSDRSYGQREMDMNIGRTRNRCSSMGHSRMERGEALG
jgi:hypothetical protein